MVLPSTKWLYTYWYGCNHSSLMILMIKRWKLHSFLPNFSTSSNPCINHKINRIFLISQHILVESLVSNLVIDLSKYKHAWKMFELGCLHQLTVIALYRLDRRKLLNFVRIPITVVYFKDRKWIPKTVYCISCLVVCKIFFCSEFPDIPDKAGSHKKKNTGNCKAFFVSRKRNEVFSYPQERSWWLFS